MGKVKRLYHQKYRTEWEKFPSFEHWLCMSSDGYSAHCRICNANILARIASIKQHHNTKKHQEGLRCNEFMTKHLVKTELHEKPIPTAFIIKNKPTRRCTQKNIETSSNDSILEDLLGNDDIERDFLALHNSSSKQESRQPMKIEELQIGELQEDAISGEHILNEFDLFGKSVSIQLNHMDLEDALMCQDRLQAVLTEFRLKILKREREPICSV